MVWIGVARRLGQGVQFDHPYLVVHLTHEDAIVALRTQQGTRQAPQRPRYDDDLVTRLGWDELQCAVGEANLDTALNGDCG